MKPELIADVKATLGEGPVWDDRCARLFWVDIERGRLHVQRADGQSERVYEIGGRVGAAVPRRAGGMILATETGFEMFDLDTEERMLLCDPESHLPHNRFNDGKCDVEGRFWAGTMSMRREPQAASLYVLKSDHSVSKMLDGVTTSNGLDWSEDLTTMYYIDTPTCQVAGFDYDRRSGRITNRRTLIQFPDGVGRPDGMTADAEGMLWIAHWDGGRVTRWNPRTGELLATLTLPVDRVTSCAFGGPGFATLFITTARHGLEPAALARQPLAGGLFAVEPKVVGRPANYFAG